ncbi:MAG: HipA domain protein [Rhodoferax sp.]|nr:HipA domain protein [Rhodoferax sp.]
MTSMHDVPGASHPKIRTLQAETPQGLAGRLVRESQFVFNYETPARACELSLAMPLRAQSYAQNTVHPAFAMNLPEGALHTALSLRFAKQFSKLDEMAMLAITGADRIGRLSPLFDVVTTAAYGYESQGTGRVAADRTLALKFRKSTSYPTREQVLAFATQCFVKNPTAVIERLGTAMSESLAANKDRLPRDFLARMQAEWDGGRALLEPGRVFVGRQQPSG